MSKTNENASAEIALGYINGRQPSEGLVLPPGEFVKLVSGLSKDGKFLANSFCMATREQIFLILVEAPETHIFTQTESRGGERTKVISTLEGAGITILGISEHSTPMVQDFLDMAKFKSFKGYRRLAALIATWVPTSFCFFVQGRNLAQLAEVIGSGLSLFISVFVVLGFERFSRDGTRIPHNSMYKMYNADRNVTILAAIGVSAAILGAVLSGVSLPARPAWNPLRFLEFGPIAAEWIAKGAVAFSVLAMLLCVLSLVSEYLDRAWMRVEADTTIHEYREWAKKAKD